MAATCELNLRLLGVAPLRRQFAALDIRDADLPELGHVVDIFLDSPTKWVGTRPVLLDVLDQMLHALAPERGFKPWLHGLADLPSTDEYLKTPESFLPLATTLSLKCKAGLGSHHKPLLIYYFTNLPVHIQIRRSAGSRSEDSLYSTGTILVSL